MVSLQDFIDLYENEFKPAYADLVAYIARKPQEILTEQENAFSHLMVYLDKKQPQAIRDENLQKAYNHILRATLDCYKALWSEMMFDINEIWKDTTKRLALKIGLDEFMKKRNEFIEKAQQARKLEIQSIGKNPLAPLRLYKEAVDIGWELIKAIDPQKEKEAKTFTSKFFTKERIIDIIIGIIAGILSTLIAQKIF